MPDQTSPLPTLADLSDVESALGRDLTDSERMRAQHVLAKASGLFRKRSGQQFTPGESTVRLRVVAGNVQLTQRPVISVDSVADDEGVAVPFLPIGPLLKVNTEHRFVTVTYSHGGEVPTLVRTTVAEVAKKVLTIDPKAAAGLTQSSTTRGPFSQADTYATWAQGGQTMLAPDDAAIAESFRVKTRFPIIQEA